MSQANLWLWKTTYNFIFYGFFANLGAVFVAPSSFSFALYASVSLYQFLVNVIRMGLCTIFPTLSFAFLIWTANVRVNGDGCRIELSTFYKYSNLKRIIPLNSLWILSIVTSNTTNTPISTQISIHSSIWLSFRFIIMYTKRMGCFSVVCLLRTVFFHTYLHYHSWYLFSLFSFDVFSIHAVTPLLLGIHRVSFSFLFW